MASAMMRVVWAKNVPISKLYCDRRHCTIVYSIAVSSGGV